MNQLAVTYAEWWKEYWDCDDVIYAGDDGFIAYQTGEDFLFIYHFFTRKGVRGTGVGLRLFHACLDRAIELGKKKLTCGVNLTMERSTDRLDMFFAHGFRVKNHDDTFLYLEHIIGNYRPKLKVVK